MTNREELETRILSHRAVREVCVVAAPDTDPRHTHYAFVVLVSHTPSLIYEFQADWAAQYSGCPARLVILPELPRSRMGRVSHGELLAGCADPAVA